MKMDRYFPKLYKRFGGDIGVKLGLSNNGAKTDLKKEYIQSSNKVVFS